MQFDLNQFLTKSTVPAEREFVLECSQDDFSGYRVGSPCQVHFSARHEGSRAMLQIAIHATIEAECARCLEPVVKVFELEQEHVTDLDQLQDEMCELPVNGRGMLDLDELARAEISLQVPQVLLCDELCKGLCPVCGKPRKLGCSCELQQADERLSVFEQLLS